MYTKLVDSKFKKEEMKMESTISKQRLLTHSWPMTVQSVSILQPDQFDSIEDPSTRQCWQVTYQELMEKKNSDLLQFSIRAQELLISALREKFTKIYDELKDNNLQHASTEKRLSASMIDILQQSFDNINRYFKCLYDHQTSYLAANFKQ
jgi:hypothetical protein